MASQTDESWPPNGLHAETPQASTSTLSGDAMFDDYLDGLEPVERQALLTVIDHVRGIAPEAEEGRSYGLPAFRHGGKPLLGFAATKSHLSLYPFSPAVVEAVKDQLIDFEVSKGAVRFTVDHPVPDDVVRSMVQERIREIDS
jgi:uncharacterized protein YdhG (YjbR/CyaY superfamily)